mgnify:CR=1 FL=1
MRRAFLVNGVRTPIGRYAGSLSQVRTDDLAAVPLRALMARHGFTLPEAIIELLRGGA